LWSVRTNAGRRTSRLDRGKSRYRDRRERRRCVSCRERPVRGPAHLTGSVAYRFFAARQRELKTRRESPRNTRKTRKKKRKEAKKPIGFLAAFLLSLLFWPFSCFSCFSW